MTTETPAPSEIYTVVGGGAIGGTLAAHIALAGHPVQIVDADTEHVAAIRSSGLKIEGPEESLSVDLPAFDPVDAPEELGPVLLAVKSQATSSAMEWIAPRLREDGYVASLQNGLNEAAIAEHIGIERTVIAFVDLFADVLQPGVIKDGGIGTIAFGEFSAECADRECSSRTPERAEANLQADGVIRPRVEKLAADLAHWGRPIVSGNVSGFLWSKLAFGAMLTATSLVDEDMASVVDSNRATMLGLAREVYAISDELGIRLESFDAFTPDDYRDGRPERVVESAFDSLCRWLEGQTKTRSGIWRDINVRKRPTEVPSQYEPVIAIASEQGVLTPRLRTLVDVIGELERGEVLMGPELLKRIS
ncbi:ketopantoate reductase family protein [Brevibacterium limosum]|uniref:ketopantoate reductase family protein n=1 Tax=Brevibacterium limosum TaxID=2697565 RepID=UPI00142130A5|nr:2-dehydropantoate 2-reductase N-terminal domain-containing protein [Brevibacterium limosum]